MLVFPEKRVPMMATNILPQEGIQVRAKRSHTQIHGRGKEFASPLAVGSHHELETLLAIMMQNHIMHSRQ